MAALRCHGSGSKRKWHILGEILWSYLGYCDRVVVVAAAAADSAAVGVIVIIAVVFSCYCCWCFSPVLQNGLHTPGHTHQDTQREISVHTAGRPK